jgi:hypothetical protein
MRHLPTIPATPALMALTPVGVAGVFSDRPGTVTFDAKGVGL